MKVVVTGKNGSLSTMLSKKLGEQYDVIQISVRGNLSDECIPNQTDCVVHIAGVTPANVKNPEDYETVNVEKTKILYQICQSKKVKHFVYISSMSVYEGYFNKLIHKDIDKKTPCMPISPYARSKFRAEKAIIDGYDDNMYYTIIRVPSLYDQNKTEYFKGYSALVNSYPIIPLSPFAGKCSILHTENMCALIQQLIEQPVAENQIILPQDEKAVTSNLIIKKIIKRLEKNKRTTYVGGLLLHLASMVIPRYRIFRSIRYAEKDSVIVNKASIDDIVL